MAAENAAGEAPATTVKKKRSKSWMVILILMVGEGAAVFYATKVLFNATPAVVEAEGAGEESEGSAGGGGHGGGEQGEAGAGGKSSGAFAEVELSECRPVNKVGGKLITVRMRVSMLVRGVDGERAKSLVEANKARINDRINFVIRSADPSHLNEPALDTIKRRIRSEMETVLCDEKLIQEILIPEMLPSGL